MYLAPPPWPALPSADTVVRTTGAIADAVGIKAPALYRYFKMKEELLYATIAEDPVTIHRCGRVGGRRPRPGEALASCGAVLFQLDWQE
ncbi:helix-turn-helix transcriptional regulator [Pseudonocardia sp. MCCB 268]|nr:helix-turn-helix transcriptional regulator [Pseudonocardia cytotoxica]